MSFDPSTLLTLKYSHRSVVVPRDRCTDYDDVIATAQRNIRSLQSLAKEDLVLRAVIPNYPDRQEIEVSKESWPLINAVVQFVTIALKSASSADPEYDMSSYEEHRRAVAP